MRPGLGLGLTHLKGCEHVQGQVQGLGRTRTGQLRGHARVGLVWGRGRDGTNASHWNTLLQLLGDEPEEDEECNSIDHEIENTEHLR